MALDIVTLMICDSSIAIFIGFALLFYQIFHKTYRGFGLWTASSFVAAFGYSSLILRGKDYGGISVLIISISFLLEALLRLDGMKRFMRDAVLGKKYYAGFLVFNVAVSGYFYYVHDNILARNLSLSFCIFLTALFIARELITYSPARKRLFYVVAAILNILMGFEVLVSAMFLLFHQMAKSPGINYWVALHQMVIILYEIGWCLIFIMMNNQRLEADLYRSQEELQASLDHLRAATSEVKMLSGLLPICSMCKNIRDDKGYWSRIEAYIATHSDAQLSHSICPDCARIHYPDLDLYDELE